MRLFVVLLSYFICMSSNGLAASKTPFSTSIFEWMRSQSQHVGYSKKAFVKRHPYATIGASMACVAAVGATVYFWKDIKRWLYPNVAIPDVFSADNCQDLLWRGVKNDGQDDINRALSLGATLGDRRYFRADKDSRKNLYGDLQLWLCNRTPLARACELGHFNVAKLLIDIAKKRNETVKNDISGSGDDQVEGAPIAYAVIGHHMNIIELLLQEGADANIKISSMPSVYETLLLLSKNEWSDPNATIIEIAIKNEDIALINLLLKYRTLGQLRDRSLLKRAVEKNNTKIVEILLEHGEGWGIGTGPIIGL